MLNLELESILKASNSASIFNCLTTLPAKMLDPDELLAAMLKENNFVTDVILEDNRRRQLAIVLAEQGSWRSDWG